MSVLLPVATIITHIVAIQYPFCSGAFHESIIKPTEKFEKVRDGRRQRARNPYEIPQRAFSAMRFREKETLFTNTYRTATTLFIYIGYEGKNKRNVTTADQNTILIRTLLLAHVVRLSRFYLLSRTCIREHSRKNWTFTSNNDSVFWVVHYHIYYYYYFWNISQF